MREAVSRIYRERKALTSSLKVCRHPAQSSRFSIYHQDVGSAVAKLDAVLIAVALILVIFLCLLIFNKSDTLTCMS